MRPYFETEIVKVKKEKKNSWVGGLDIENKSYKILRNKNGIHYLKEFDKPKKGNWVNGENLDKIQYPAYCRFDANKGMFGDPSKSYKVHGIGKIDFNYTEGQRQYQLSWADHQQKDLSVLCETPSLRRLIEIYDIHILKAKIILFEEE